MDSVLESTRAKEEALKKETAEQLNLFRRQQEEADRALLPHIDNAEEEIAAGKSQDLGTTESQWAINDRKKRKRGDKEVLKGVKLRKGSTSIESSLPSDIMSGKVAHAEARLEPNRQHVAGEKLGSHPKRADDKAKKLLLEKDHASQPILGLAAYSSDEED